MKIVLINLFLCVVTCNMHRPGNEPFLIIGIFSNCNTTNHTHQQEFHQNADVCKKSLEWVVQNRWFVANATELYYRTYKEDYFQKQRTWSVDDVHYVSFDVCTELDVVKLAVDILLNPKYHVSNKYQTIPSWMGITIQHYKRITRIVAVMLYTSDFITDRLLGLLRLATFPVYHLNHKWRLPIKYERRLSDITRKKIFVSNTYYHEHFQRIQIMLKRKNVTKFDVVLIGKKNKFYEYFLQKLNVSNKYFYSVKEINILSNDSFNKLLERLRERQTFKYIFLFGHGSNQINVYNKAIRMGITNKTWYFLQNIEASYREIESIPEGTDVLTLSSTRNQDLFFFEKLKPTDEIHAYITKNLERKLIIDNMELSETSDQCSRKMKRMYTAYFKSVDTMHHRSIQFLDLYLERFQLYMPVNGAKALLFLQFDGKGRLNMHFTFKYKKLKDNLVYKKPICQRGWQNYYGRVFDPIIKEEFYWNYTIGWSCEKCPENFYKDFTGEGRCIQCPRMTSASMKRDYCYDPYHDVYNSIDRLSVQLCIGGSSLGFLLTTITIFIFSWNRETPLVRASVFRLSAIHLILLWIAFVSYPILFFSKPTVIICCMRPLVISFINLLCVVAMLIKSNKILVAFQSKVRVSKEDNTRLSMVYIILIFILISIGAFIGFISLTIQPSNIRKTTNHISMTRDLACSTGMNVNLQIFYLLILHLLPAVQAFRGRHLPGPFNEALAIVYITFITIIAYCTMVPIYYSQKVESDKATVQCCVLTIANLVQVSILYPKKTYIILFRDHKNSKEYVQKRTQNTILKKH